MLTLGVGNGSWERTGLEVAPGYYQLEADAGDPDLVAVPGAYAIRVPEIGVFWRHGAVAFEFVRREEAVQRFGLPFCGPPGRHVSPCDAATSSWPRKHRLYRCPSGRGHDGRPGNHGRVKWDQGWGKSISHDIPSASGGGPVLLDTWAWQEGVR